MTEIAGAALNGSLALVSRTKGELFAQTKVSAQAASSAQQTSSIRQAITQRLDKAVKSQRISADEAALIQESLDSLDQKNQAKNEPADKKPAAGSLQAAGQHPQGANQGIKPAARRALFDGEDISNDTVHGKAFFDNLLREIEEKRKNLKKEKKEEEEKEEVKRKQELASEERKAARNEITSTGNSKRLEPFYNKSNVQSQTERQTIDFLREMLKRPLIDIKV